MDELGQKDWQRGRRHLDGSPPGAGQYLESVTVSLRPLDIALLEEVGDGNRSQAVRDLLQMYRSLKEQAAATAVR